MCEIACQIIDDDTTNVCRELLSEQDWILGWQALATLRPQLPLADFLERKSRLQAEGYHLVGLFNENKVISVASYTISPHAFFEREMIIHDMSTLAGESSKGYGSKLLQYLDQLAVQLRCARTILWSAKAADFYTKNGFLAHATGLKKLHEKDNKSRH